jgi:WD40 repeat protein
MQSTSGLLLWTQTRVVLSGQESPVYSVAFSPDGQRVMTAGNNGAAHVWDSSSGKEIMVLRHKGSVQSAAFSPDGQRVVTATGMGGDQSVLVWRVPPRCQALVEAAEMHARAVPRELSAAERAQYFLADQSTDSPGFLSRVLGPMLALALSSVGDRCE